ncbi:transmembrane protein, putative (macronuclear) [Tetrahymena thermophila SB210]|uniref:Transmembrane protein, putative n=1 Tax=Tetrahymena thermophila (strain SB210) TaxID=312017 RepID=I7M7T7_TETTS|nr:transmembrane protein, putative [Tetrahymena thermophila SB210]EAR95973.2 transmembrane protein, putative [Tetrahymena thermophila SB210]|eukprot:XP_001016218.2 transmembrane protein, putative [Tetrahymena thermophila SB210]
MTKIKLVLFLLAVFISLAMILAALQGNKMIQNYYSFNKSIDSDLALDKQYSEIFGANDILIKVEFFCFFVTLLGFFFSHVQFESKISRILVALSFISSTVWINFAFLFLYGASDLNNFMAQNYLYVKNLEEKNDPENQPDPDMYLFVNSWRILYQIRKIIFISIIPTQIVYLIFFRKFFAQKKQFIEKQKLQEMMKIYEQLEQNQI